MIEQIVSPAQAVEQMARGEIDIGLVIRVTPDVIADRRIHIFLGRLKIFPIAFNLVGKGCFCDADTDFILRASLLRGRCCRLSLEGTHFS